MEEVGAFGGYEAVEEVSDAVDQGVDGAGGLLPQERLEFCERHLVSRVDLDETLPAIRMRL